MISLARSPRLFLTLLLTLISLPSLTTAHAQAKPEIKSIVPNYAAIGKTTKLTLFGENLAPTSARTNRPQVSIKLGEVKSTEGEDKSKGSKRVSLEVMVDARCPIENVEITLEQSGSTGKSQITTSLSLVEGTDTELPAKRPNTSFKDAMILTTGSEIPSLSITGNVEGDNPATFRFEGKKGQGWHFQVFAGRGGSPLDPVLRLRDSLHRSLALRAGHPKSDLILDFTVPTDGTYYLELMDEQSRGGGNFTYRLSVRPLSIHP